MSDRKLAQLKEILADLTPAELSEAASLVHEKQATVQGPVTAQPSVDQATRVEAWHRLEEIGRQISANMSPGGISMTEQLSRDRSSREWS